MSTTEQFTTPSDERSRRFQFPITKLLPLFLGLAFAAGWFGDHLLMRWQMKRMREADAAYFTEQLRMQAAEAKRNQEALGIVGVGGLQGLEVQGVSFQTEPISAWMFHSKLGDRHVAEVAKIPSIKKLELGSPNLTIQCLQHLVRLSNLESLQLSGEWVKDGAAEMISDNSRLKKLDLQEVSLSDDQIRALVMRFPNLQELNLIHDASAGTQTIAAVANLKDLRTFIISTTTLKDDDCAPLSAMISLEHLEILKCSLSDAALTHIGQIESLIELDLSGNSLTDEGLHQLAGLKNLRKLNILNTLVTSTKALEVQLPDCQIAFQPYADNGMRGPMPGAIEFRNPEAQE